MAVQLLNTSIIIRRQRIEWSVIDELMAYARRDMMKILRHPSIHADTHLVVFTFDQPVPKVVPLCKDLGTYCGLDAEYDYEVHSTSTGPVFEVDWLKYAVREGVLFCYHAGKPFGKAALATQAIMPLHIV